MTNVYLTPLPGVCKVNSVYASSVQSAYNNGKLNVGRFTDMDGTIFIAGMPEKIGGWMTEISTPVTGVPRGLRDWRDNNAATYLGIGTNSKLEYLNSGILTDITPWRAILTGTLTNPFTTNSTTTVSVAHTAHGLSSGDYVMLTSSASISGIVVSGVFNPITKVDANNYTIVVPSPALSSVSGGGGTVSYVYYRVTLTNPFSTVINTPTVTVAHNNHGAIVGDYVTISNSSAVGGITPSGEVQVVTATTNTWTFTWTSNATSTVNGGGGSPQFQYDINVGNVDASTSFGYGTGGYGLGGYGQNGAVGVTTPPRVWALAKYGQQLLASPYGGTIYIWDPTIGGRAYPMYNAPTSCLWMLVTPERFVFAVGTLGSGYMQVQSSDQTNYNIWTAALGNTAFARTLQEGSYLVGGIPVRDEVTLIFSNTTAYLFNWTGDQFFYDSVTAAIGSGLIGPLAVTVMSGIAYWMSPSEFWMWNGAVQPLPSDDIRDYVFKNLNLAQSYKFCAGTNIAKKQVIFFYVSSNATEIDSYAIYHIDQACWSTGSVLKRTSWIDRGLFSYPQAVDASGYIYNQESGTDSNGSALDSYVVFSPMDISKGDMRMDVFSFIPDFERQVGNVSLTVNMQTYPQDTPTTTVSTIAANDTTPRIDLRNNAKLIGYKLESNTVGGDWRLGIPRVEAQAAGARR